MVSISTIVDRLTPPVPTLTDGADPPPADARGPTAEREPAAPTDENGPEMDPTVAAVTQEAVKQLKDGEVLGDELLVELGLLEMNKVAAERAAAIKEGIDAVKVSDCRQRRLR